MSFDLLAGPQGPGGPQGPATGPVIAGGTAPNSSLTLEGTSNGSPSGDAVNLIGTAINIQGSVSDTTVTIGKPGSINILDIGIADQAPGSLSLAGSTSGKLRIFPAAANSGTTTLTFPAGSTDFSATGAAGAVVRQDSSGAAFTVGAIVTAQSTPADPTLTTSTTGVMMGLAASITPLHSGKFLVIISGDCTDSVISDGAAMQIRFGTGTAPVNGAALTGTAAGGVVKSNDAAAAGRTPFHLNAIVAGTVNVANWVDISLAAITGGNASVFDVSISLIEL